MSVYGQKCCAGCEKQLPLDRFPGTSSRCDECVVYAKKKKRLLSPRRREVAELIRLGKDNFEIALILGCSPNTVKNHVRAILQRLEVPNRTRLAAVYTELKLKGEE